MVSLKWVFVLLVPTLFACGGTSSPEPENNQNNENNENNPVVLMACEIPETGCTELSSITDGIVLEDRCYQINATLNIDGFNLDVPAGTVMVFGEDAGLNFRSGGSLNAIGTTEEPVCFLGSQATAGHWRGLRFIDSGEGQSRLSHAVVSHAGSSSWELRRIEYNQGAVVLTNSGNVVIENSEFRNNAEVAINASEARESDENQRAILELNGVLFAQNALPLRIAPYLAQTISDLNFEENDDDIIWLNSFYSTAPLGDDLTLKALEAPYVLRDTLLNTDGARLTLEPGVEILFGEDAGLHISGESVLVAQGSEEEMIVLRGEASELGSWRGIRFADAVSESNLLAYVLIEDAGSEPWDTRQQLGDQGGVSLIGDDTWVRIADTTFRNNAYTGLNIVDSPSLTAMVSGSTFIENERPVMAHANQIRNLAADLHFESNTEDAVVIIAPNEVTNIVSTTTTWPAYNVPYRMHETVRVETHLEITPGAVLEFMADKGLRFDGGTLGAEGTTEDLIILRGFESEVGYWAGLYFVASYTEENKIAHAEINDAGGVQWVNGRAASQAGVTLAGASAICGDESLVDIRDTTFNRSGGHGIAIRYASRVTGCNGNEFNEIEDYDVLDDERMQNDPDYSEFGGCYCVVCECEL